MTLALTLTEFKLFLREKIGPAFGVGFPVLLLVIFGNIPFYRKPDPTFGGLTLLDVYVPILVAFVLAMLALNTVPPALAGYRERGVLRRLRTTPVGPVRVLVAQLTLTAAMAVVAITSVLLVARFAFAVRLPKQFGGFLLTVLLAGAALIAMGLFAAAVSRTGKAANALGATMFYPTMFFAGLFLPIDTMPPVLRHISHATPLGAAVTALQDATAGNWPHALPLLTMAAYALVFGAAAARLFRWE